MAWIDSLFNRMVEVGASDLHMTSTLQPMFRLHGDMIPVEGCPEISTKQMQQVLMEITPDKNQKEFELCCDTDFAYAIPGLARFRVNLFTDSRGPGAVFRVIPEEILTAEQLELPKAVTDFCYLSKGLVLVTGPTGSGKSTTLAAMIDHINKNRADHIITIEDPIEFVHPSHKCLINQREVGGHTESFKRALRAALREDPDIVLVGEMRDLETIEIAIETAETGHLVFGTLHTTTAASTVDRIIDQFPADRQAQIRTMLSSSLKGVVAQTLCKKKSKGRVAALEILVVNSAVASQIRDGKTHQIPSTMQMGVKLGMCTLNDSLEKLVASDEVSAEEAYIKAVDKEGFKTKLKHLGVELNLGASQKVEEASAGALPQAAPASGLAMGHNPEPQAPLPSAPQAEEQAPSSGPPAGIGDPFERFKKRRNQ
ncbi:MAG: PilT/PilU family type 4a pilus ATPase [Planctomycetes bacterium]|nr:PilT/PilU family type 4a pilus ATPase [Planctomycetota bacterium]